MATATETPTRERILYASAELFRRQGYGGTGLKQVVAQAGAPFGSLYHFFPGGKEQLADEVLRTSGRFFLALYESISAAAPDFEGAVADFFSLHAFGFEWYVFNIADCAIVAGVVGLLYESLFRGHKKVGNPSKM